MSEKDDKIIATALERFKHCEDAESAARDQAMDELKFSLGEQWPEEIRKERESDPNGARPCLTVDKLDQYIKQVVNDARQNKPGIKIRPRDDGADPETAEVLQGLARQIEDQSCADVAYDTAVEMAARCGFGYVRIVTDYEDDEGFEQGIFIRAVANPFSCYLDPDHVNPDGSDARFGFAWEDMPREQFEHDFPDADPCDFAASSQGDSEWIREKTVRVAEYFECVYEDKTVYQAPDGSASDEKIEGAISRKLQRKKVIWRKMTAKEVLEEREWAGKYIPIVPTYGHRIKVGTEWRYSSLHKPAMDAMRMYNYAASAFVERVALTPKAPYIATAHQIEGYEAEWAAANTSNASVLPYNPDPDSPPPQRQQASDLPTGWMQVMQGMEHDIQGALGMYNASLGAPSNEKSGKAIVARQREADNATFHIIDNLSRCIRHVGRIIVDLIPKIYDTRRVVRVLGEDGSEEFAELDPDQPEARRDIKDVQGHAIASIYNPGVGRYDVTVTTGPAYGTKRQEAAEFLTQIVQSSPDLMPVIGDLMFKSMDMPFADDIAERMKKMMPPQLQEQEEGAQPAIPPQVQMAIEQMQQAFQQSQQAAQQLAQELEQAQQDSANKAAELDLKAREIGVKEYEAETERMQALAPAITPEQVQALVIQTLQDIATQSQSQMPMAQEPMHMMPDGSMMPDAQMGMQAPEMGPMPPMQEEFPQ